jgi:hypothetical protein
MAQSEWNRKSILEKNRYKHPHSFFGEKTVGKRNEDA